MAGRPLYEPCEADRRTVRILAAIGTKHEEIARCLGTKGIDDKTLRKHFRRELDTARTDATNQIAGKVFEAAIKGESWACCFWLKTQARWHETAAHRFVDENDKDRPFNLADVDRIIAEAEED